MTEDERVAAVMRAWAERPSPGDPYDYAGPGGNVRLGAVQRADGGGIAVWLGDPIGAPAFKIINPPLIVVEPGGNLREDPLEALAQVIAGAGGSRPGRRNK